MTTGFFLKKLFRDPFKIPDFYNQGRILSLDGLRAFSILIVIFGHIGLTDKSFSRFQDIINAIIGNGSSGVRFFFVISGFIITTLLIKEGSKTNNIDLRRFYIRRVLRIFPALYFYLFTLLILIFVFNWQIEYRFLVAAALYVSNFSFLPNTFVTGHTWSLSVEEQYYLLWPWLLKKAKRTAIILAATCLLLAPGIRVFIHFYPAYTNFSLAPFWINADAIFCGCLLAILISKNLFPVQFFKNNKSIIALTGFLLFFGINSLLWINKNIVLAAFLISSQTLVIGALIVANSFYSRNILFRLLNSRLFTGIGKISYSLYLWQQLFVIPPHVRYYSHASWNSFPLNLFCIFAAGSISYFLIEKPFLRLKKKYSVA